MSQIEIRESEIEDIFAVYPDLLTEILGLKDDIFLIARQKILPSGRTDIIVGHLDDIILIELKVESFRRSFVKQILGYHSDLLRLQEQKKFVQGRIYPYILAPYFSNSDYEFASANGVSCKNYDPEAALKEFFDRAPLDTKCFSTVPTDKGVWRIGLINETLYLLNTGNQRGQIARQKNVSIKTIGNQLRLAEELGLIYREGRKYELTVFGKQYAAAKDSHLSKDTLSQEQSEVVRRFILSNPFYSGLTFGILTMIGSVFELSRNTYPVPLDLLSRHFISSSGLHFSWDKNKAINKGVRMYSNYAIELGLIGKIGNKYFVTPSGLNFVLLLNMHKSIKFIEAIKTIR